MIGAAVYLELWKDYNSGRDTMTTQVILIPETQVGVNYLPYSMYWRRISTDFPRKNWSYSTSGHRSTTLLASDTPDAAVAKMNAEIVKYIGGMLNSGWTLRKEPIIVELDIDDVQTAKLGKTPYKVLGRVNRTRIALGFPDKLLNIGS